MKGRRPDSDVTREAKGAAGKRRSTAPVDAPASASAIRPLAKLTPAATAIWRSLAPDLERRNLLRDTDRQALARYCQDVTTYWTLAEELRREGVTYVTESAHGTMRRVDPRFLVQERIVTRLIAAEDRFGLSPLSRQQLLRLVANAQGSLAFPGPGATPDAPPAVDPESPIGFLN